MKYPYSSFLYSLQHGNIQVDHSDCAAACPECTHVEHADRDVLERLVAHIQIVHRIDCSTIDPSSVSPKTIQIDTSMATVTVGVKGGPSIDVPWSDGMNAQKALEAANTADPKFVYSLQYFGNLTGYLVIMINGTYESFLSSAAPFFYWEFFINETPATVGIDQVILKPGDSILFSLEMYSNAAHAATTVQKKYTAQVNALKG